MAMRTPSRPRPKAMPLPMPRLPPVIKATRWRNADNPPPRTQNEQTRYRIPGELPSARKNIWLAEPGDDYRHVVGLLWRASPLFYGGEQRLSDTLDTGVAEAQNFACETRGAKFFAVNVLRLEQTVTEADKYGTGLDSDYRLQVLGVIEEADDGSALVQFFHMAVANKKWSNMAGVGVSQGASGVIVFRIKKSRISVVRSIDVEMLVERRHNLTRRSMAIENRLTAKRGLQAGHEKRGGDSFAADIGNGHADRRRAKLHEIVVVARDDAC